MAIDAKICGINSAPALDAAVKGGARFVGFNFYARSPRALDAEGAAALAGRVPRSISRVGVIVDESNETIDGILRQVPLDMFSFTAERRRESASTAAASANRS
jgi:phosphoribosylanthranilate isomerase